MTVVELATGAEMRLTGSGPTAVVCVNGGQAAEVAGTWSASLEWLVGRLAPQFPELAFAEVRYRIKSWKRLDDCVADARAAIRAVGAERTLLLGFSMGGAVSISAADEPAVTGVLGLAPWIPERLSLEPLRGKRFDVLHGSLDRWLPGIPGVSASSSRRGFERALAVGVNRNVRAHPRCIARDRVARALGKAGSPAARRRSGNGGSRRASRSSSKSLRSRRRA